jgi:hypothetical protein
LHGRRVAQPREGAEFRVTQLDDFLRCRPVGVGEADRELAGFCSTEFQADIAHASAWDSTVRNASLPETGSRRTQPEEVQRVQHQRMVDRTHAHHPLDLGQREPRALRFGMRATETSLSPSLSEMQRTPCVLRPMTLISPALVRTIWPSLRDHHHLVVVGDGEQVDDLAVPVAGA